jgi:acyl transferase domain-containing protein
VPLSTGLEIAVVGMAGRFPGARDLAEFWRNLEHGVESIERLEDDDILASGVPPQHLRDPRYVRASPLLDRPGHFDAGFFGYSPTEARAMDPQQRLLLELAWEALEHAGYDADRYDGRIGVYAGAALNTYFTSVGLSARLAEDYIPTLIGNDKDFLGTRISYKLNLKGPSLTVQTACSTSLVAVHLACQSLLSEETDMALAGAISVRVPHRAGYFCDGGGVVSPDGHVRAFDARANGTVFGSGGGVLVLKRLLDARNDGDTVHAVIKGTAVNNDGSAKAGYTAPSVDAQATAVIEALANAGVSADSVSYVEAHGSGTPVGDPIEVRALTKAFRASTRRSGFCALGSVKTNVGHLDAAAGMAGMLKTILSLAHRRIPASLHFRDPNPEIDFAGTPFYVNTRLREWTSDAPRRAGVMSTGMGGTNAHVVLEEASGAGSAVEARPPYLLVLSARTPAALEQATQRLREFLSATPSADMAGVAYTLQLGRKQMLHRRCLVCDSREDAVTALGEAQDKRALSGRASDSPRPLILLLPGIGDHYVGMAGDLYEGWPVFRDEVDRCARLLEPLLGLDIRRVLYPEGGSRRSEPGKRIDLKRMLARAAAPDRSAATLNETRFAQPALFTIEYATARLWQSLGVAPRAILGHSLGEYAAACLAGVFSLEDALRLVAVRARLASALPEGAMLAVALPESELLPLLPRELSISLINGVRLCVVAGPPAAVDHFERMLEARGVISRRVRNGHAFHSRMLEPIVGALEAEARRIPLRAPALPFVSNVSGTWITPEQAQSPAYWALHAARTSRFCDALGELWKFEDPVLLEAGPGRTLSVLALQHPARRGEAVAAASIRHDYENLPDDEVLCQAIGRLWLAGAPIDWRAAPWAAARRRVPLPTYPFERELYWLEPPREAAASRRADPDAFGKRPLREWLYAPSWKRLLPRGAPRVDASRRRWLVLEDRAGLARALSARLRAAGDEVVSVREGDAFARSEAGAFTIAPGRCEDYAALIRTLRAAGGVPERIVHAWSLAIPDPAQGARERFEGALSRGFYSLAYLLRALAARGGRRGAELFALCAGVHDVHGGEELRPEDATLLGACLVARQEYPDLRVKCIDVEPFQNTQELEAAAALAWAELSDPDSSLLVAHRSGRRWAQTFESIPFPAKAARPPFRERGSYLITGGLGRIGLAIAAHLAAGYRARLALVGRSPLPPREDWPSVSESDARHARIAAIRRIEDAGGEVLYLSANVADVNALRIAVEQTQQRFSGLDGVVHAAGIVGDAGYCEIKDTDPASCGAHFEAKALGLLALAEALEGRRVDFCLLFSSLASVLGGLGQGAYAAANLFMDSLARSRNRSSSTRWLSLNWDVWRLADGGEFGRGRGVTLAGFGMSAAEGMAVMEAALNLGTADQLVVSTGDLAARIDQWVTLESLHPETPEPRHGAARSPSEPPRPSLAPLAEPRSETERRVAEVWQQALGIDAIGTDDGFAELGGHSLLAVRIVSELRKAFDVDLPVRALFDAPTIAELSRYIENRVAAEIGALTDEEARRLLSGA